ncbi:MAG TPA: hypothetical protein VMT52_13930, partial [Planctomycetota bacterium]|nr:hypothetical protein [Planctomycetota bacterium]
MSTRLSRLVLRQGSDEAPPPLVPLRAGPLTLVLEGPDLRYIRLGDVEIVRRLHVSVRDRNWGTVAPRLSNVVVEKHADSFRVSFDAESREGEIDFAWRGEVTGAPDGTIAYTLDGEARSDFLRNRLGFCILHPIRECAGAPCRVVHADGSVEEGTFPRLIAPRAPFQEMRAIFHEVTPGVRADLEMEGEIFEMEDQRNWTDASFKTFCTPLRIPFPAAVSRGARIAQSVTLRLRGKAPPRPARAPGDQVSIEVHGGGGRPLPEMGLGAASHGEPLTEREILRLR